MVNITAPVLCGCASAAEVRAHLGAQSQTCAKARFGVCGILRAADGATKLCILDSGVAHLAAVVSMAAARVCGVASLE